MAPCEENAGRPSCSAAAHFGGATATALLHHDTRQRIGVSLMLVAVGRGVQLLTHRAACRRCRTNTARKRLGRAVDRMAFGCAAQLLNAADDVAIVSLASAKGDSCASLSPMIRLQTGSVLRAVCTETGAAPSEGCVILASANELRY